MFKKNLFKKKSHKSVLSITKRIESFFNFLRENFFLKKKKTRNFQTFDKRIFFAAVIIFFTTISYLLIPAFYNKIQVRDKIESQILNQYNLKVKFKQTLKYGLFPKPHFYSKETVINHKSDEIAKTNSFRIFISIKNLFSIKNIQVRDIVFKKTDFKINNKNIDFFTNLLNRNNSDHQIKFLDSKLFYVDKNEDIIFLTNLKNLNYLYQNILQKLKSKLNIFNIPLSLDVDHDIIEKKIFLELKSYPLRLNVKSSSNYNNKELSGLTDLSIVNKSKKIGYELKNNSLNFKTSDNKISGNILIKPFFLSSNINLFEIDIKKVFHDNSILINILKSEILNNKNLNGEILVNAQNFKGINFLKDINFKIVFEEGEIFIKNLKMIFKDSVIINLDDSQLIIDNNRLDLAGYISLDFININGIYSHFQISKKNRKKIDKINLGYLFNFNERLIEIDNLKINGIPNEKAINFQKKMNSEKENILNKIIFRNLIKDFFKNL